MGYRQCTNSACLFAGQSVKTDRATCLSCNQPLKKDLASNLKEAFDLLSDGRRQDDRS